MMNRIHTNLLLIILSVILAPAAAASTTWYVDGVDGSDTNNCLAAHTACKTIGHAISRAVSGDSIMVAAATYTENLTIPYRMSLNVIGANAITTIIDGGRAGSVITISLYAVVTLSNLTIRNGMAEFGGGIDRVLAGCHGVDAAVERVFRPRPDLDARLLVEFARAFDEPGL